MFINISSWPNIHLSTVSYIIDIKIENHLRSLSLQVGQ